MYEYKVMRLCKISTFTKINSYIYENLVVNLGEVSR